MQVEVLCNVFMPHLNRPITAFLSSPTLGTMTLLLTAPNKTLREKTPTVFIKQEPEHAQSAHSSNIQTCT